MTQICLKNISKRYREKGFEVQALRDVSLEIKKGEMIAIMGASGSGKSTLLNIMGCMDKATGGSYQIGGVDISDYSEKQMAKLRNSVFGFVMQDFALIERYPVYKNVELPLYYSEHRENKRNLDDILKRLGILKQKNQLPLRLSGGQRQRVAIARALINRPEVILADEPTGALDRKTSDEIMELFQELNGEGHTIVIVTHDAEVARRCGRTVRIEDGEILL